jgi:RNA polymerase sigma factor (sigma-70 family)
MIETRSASGESARYDDETLVRDCVQGNQTAWHTLIDKYRNLVFSIPIKFGLSVDDASDVFQNVCMKLMAELPRLREPKTLAAWLMQVTAHEAFRWRRKSGAYGTLKLDGQSAQCAASEKLPDAILEELRREQILREAISEAPPRCRELIEALFYSVPPRPYELVAKDLGLATGSIGFIRMRCLERLRRELEQRGFS